MDEYQDKKIFVTSYKNPDLDGFGSAYAYAEFLNLQGIDAVHGVFGTPRNEVGFVLKEFDIKYDQKSENLLGDYPEVVLADASSLPGLPSQINPKSVVEIIDHRKVHEAENFPNAKAQLELVGAAATLIAEKFYHAGIEPSKESAVLLFFGIVSNTINFKNNVTTDRDRKIGEWLKVFFEFKEGQIDRFFESKVKISDSVEKSLDYKIISYAVPFDFGGNSIGIAQLEMVDVENFINSNLDEIEKRLEELKKDRDIDLVFLTCVDLKEYFNLYVCFEEKMKTILSTTLGLEFTGALAKKDGILMRKEIAPILKEYLEKN